MDTLRPVRVLANAEPGDRRGRRRVAAALRAFADVIVRQGSGSRNQCPETGRALGLPSAPSRSGLETSESVSRPTA